MDDDKRKKIPRRKRILPFKHAFASSSGSGPEPLDDDIRDAIIAKGGIIPNEHVFAISEIRKKLITSNLIHSLRYYVTQQFPEYDPKQLIDAAMYRLAESHTVDEVELATAGDLHAQLVTGIRKIVAEKGAEEGAPRQPGREM